MNDTVGLPLSPDEVSEMREMLRTYQAGRGAWKLFFRVIISLGAIATAIAGIYSVIADIRLWKN